MAISVDWATQIITVPKADTQLVSIGPPEIRSLDLDTFRKALNALQAGEEGLPEPTTHLHVAPLTVGGVTLARSVEIINGYTVTFENGAYAVNLVGANSNVGDVLNLNTVSVRTANSAGLTFSEAINDQSFLDARVWINTLTGNSGVDFPRGTPPDPVDNFADADTIAGVRGFNTFNIQGPISLSSSTDIAGSTWFGHEIQHATITLVSGVDTTGCVFNKMTIGGAFAGSSTVVDSVVNVSTGFCGGFTNCAFAGDITMDATCTTTFWAANCRSQIAGTGRPSLDVNGAATDINVRNYSGGLTLKNLTTSNSASLDINSGTIEIASTCTAGTVVVRGVGVLIDNSGVGCTVVSDGFTNIANQIVEGTTTTQDILRLVAAVLGGKVSGVTTSTERFRDPNDTKDRVTVTLDGSGNRTSVVLDLT